MPRIAFIGLGRMGLPMSAALAAAGYEVIANDKRAELKADALASGLAWRDTPAHAAAAAGVLITMLPGPGDVAEVLTGPRGAARELTAGTTWIDMSSNSPAAARPLQEDVIRQGADVLEAPVGGGVQAARDGMLQLFVGGDEDVLERHRTLLEVLADPQRIVHVGGHGAGYTAKLLANLLWFGQAVATAEAVLLGQRAGIDPAVLKQALGSSSAASAFINRDLDAVFQGGYLPSFGLNGICQELDAVTALAREHQTPFELSDVVRRTYRRALERYGPADGELLAMALLEDEAGQKLRPGAPDTPAGTS